MSETTLVIVGSSFKTAPLELLESLSSPPDDIQKMLPKIKNAVGAKDVVFLSTCNRTEIYAATESPAASTSLLENWLIDFSSDKKPIDPVHLYSFQGPEAINHLMKVTAGLDSLILGETEITGQVHAGLELARKAGSASSFSVQLFSTAFRAAKRSRTETSIDQGNTSVASAAVHLSRRVFGDFADVSALVVGAGDTGNLVSQYLSELSPKELVVTNRTSARSQETANRHGGRAVSFEKLEQAITKADVIFCATHAKEPLITAQMVGRAMSFRASRTMLIIDISLPHNVEPEAGKIENVFLNDMKDLRFIVQKNLERRAEEVPSVEKIIDQEIACFNARQSTMQVGPLIKELRQSFDDLRESELKRFSSKLSAEDFPVVERMTRDLVNKLLHWPTLEIRALAQDPNYDGERMAMLRRLFGLVKNEQERKDK